MFAFALKLPFKKMVISLEVLVTIVICLVHDLTIFNCNGQMIDIFSLNNVVKIYLLVVKNYDGIYFIKYQ